MVDFARLEEAWRSSANNLAAAANAYLMQPLGGGGAAAVEEEDGFHARSIRTAHATGTAQSNQRLGEKTAVKSDGPSNATAALRTA